MNKYDLFVLQLGPTLYKALKAKGVKNINKAYDHMIRQLAWESNYGQSPVARKQHNYGGYGWNGKTYTTFKNDEDFINHYVKLMTGRYSAAVDSPDVISFARNLKNKGYYEDSFEHYSNSLAGMRSVSRAAANHFKANPNLYLFDAATIPVQSFPRIEMPRYTLPVDNTRTANVVLPETVIYGNHNQGDLLLPDLNEALNRRMGDAMFSLAGLNPEDYAFKFTPPVMNIPSLY